MTNPYKNGKIYQLICEQSGDIYIGSTIRDLGERLMEHKKKGNNCVSRHFINPKIMLLKNVECNSKKELEQMERFYIENNECVNKRIPGRTIKEWKEDNKEELSIQRKKYQEKNKEKILLYEKERYKKNKEKIALYQKEYYEKNKEKIYLRQKEYIEKNKDQLSLKGKEKITCECSAIIRKDSLSKHKKSKKHINSMV